MVTIWSNISYDYMYPQYKTEVFSWNLKPELPIHFSFSSQLVSISHPGLSVFFSYWLLPLSRTPHALLLLVATLSNHCPEHHLLLLLVVSSVHKSSRTARLLLLSIVAIVHKLSRTPSSTSSIDCCHCIFIVQNSPCSSAIGCPELTIFSSNWLSQFFPPSQLSNLS